MDQYMVDGVSNQSFNVLSDYIISTFLFQIAENYSTNRPDFEPSKRYNCDSNSNGATAEPSTAAADRRSLPYPHSMPTSPTMFERGNESRCVIKNARIMGNSATKSRK